VPESAFEIQSLMQDSHDLDFVGRSGKENHMALSLTA
jgi:hypothetical protein